jgi:regulator of replication initiation timing
MPHCQHTRLRCRECLRDVEDGLYENLISLIQENTQLKLELMKLQADQAVIDITLEQLTLDLKE